MTGFVFTPLAAQDLQRITDYVAGSNGPQSAMKLLDDLLDAAQRLARMPRLGRVRRVLAPDSVRFWPVHGYLIVYRHQPCPIEIVRVVEGRRDLRALLGVRPPGRGAR